MIVRFLSALLALISLAPLASAQSRGWELRVCAEADLLPYSNEQGQGFENRIAELLAEELGASLDYVWLDQAAARTSRLLLQEGECDLVMGAAEGHPDLLTTIAYYRSSYVFVYPVHAEFELATFDDAVLSELSIGVQAGSGGLTPVVYALANRELIDNQVTFMIENEAPDPLGGIVVAVAEGNVDLAIVWGPVAGYFAAQQPVELKLVPVMPQIEPPFVPMVTPIAIAVRAGDEALRDDLSFALARRWEEIQQVLAEYHVPLEPLPRPTLGAGAD